MKNLILAAILLSAPAGARAASSLDEAMRMMTERRYPEAVAALEREERSNPGSPEVLLNLGWAYWHANRIKDARRVGSTLIKLDPANIAFMVFLANTDIEIKDYRAAAELMTRALKQAPGDRDASMVLSRALFRLNRQKEAFALLDGVIAKYPDLRIARYRKAMFLFESGRKQEALATLEKLIAADPKNPDYRRSRAKILSELGRTEEAKEVWTGLSRSGPDANALMNLGWTYWREKNYEQSFKIGELLLKLDGNDPVFLRFMANLEIERLNYPEALRLAQKAQRAAPGDKNVALTLSKVLFRMQREPEAMAVLKDLVEHYPDDVPVMARWAEFCARMGWHDEALFYADKLIKADPANPAHRATRAGILYDMGRFDEAVGSWKSLAAGSPPNVLALRRLRDDAFDRQAWAEAEAWQRKIIDSDPANPAAWDKLSRIRVAMGDLPKALAAIEKSIEVDPVPMASYYQKAEILEAMNDVPRAKAAFVDIVARNPNSFRAFDGLSSVLEAEGDSAGALQAVRRSAELTEPSVSPYVQIHEARLLADMGHYVRAHSILTRLSQDRKPVIPVLLYHGVARHDRGDSLSQAALREQLKALVEHGYHPIVASQLERAMRGQEALPEKPLLVTFDDARNDSFENADPVLKELGIRATMFVHLSKLRKSHFHASPDDIRKWQATGRWEMQSHGYEAHDPMPIDGEGRMGHFLPNRRWLAGLKRLETHAEYRLRLDGEYRRMKEGLQAILPGREVIAFAYPYGDYGQNDYTNTPESAAINRELVRKYFRLAFVQERFGVNSLSSNPTDLRRFEVPRHMTAAQLVNHLAYRDPRVQARLADAALWVAANQPGRARAVYASLQAEGVDQPAVWAEQGVALRRGGDVYRAQKLFQEAVRDTPHKDDPGADLYNRLLRQSGYAAAPSLSGEVQRFTDSDRNEISKAFGRVAASVLAFRATGFYGEGRYKDRLNPAAERTVRSKEGGLQLRGFLTDELELNGMYARRSFMEGASGFSDNYSAALAYQLLPPLAVTARGGGGNVETARAVLDRRNFRNAGGGLIWDPWLNWRANGDYDETWYSDKNRQKDIRGRLTRRLTTDVSVGAGYYHGDSDRRDPTYYTPRNLNQYTGILTLTHAYGAVNERTGLRRAETLLQYEGGYGRQETGSRVIHGVRGGLSLRLFDRVMLTLDGQYSQSPTYISRRADGGVTVSF